MQLILSISDVGLQQTPPRHRKISVNISMYTTSTGSKLNVFCEAGTRGQYTPLRPLCGRLETFHTARITLGLRKLDYR